MLCDISGPREIKVRRGHRGPHHLPRHARDFGSSRVVPAKITGQSDLIEHALPLPLETEKQVVRLAIRGLRDSPWGSSPRAGPSLPRVREGL
jgi:hypothetical protein